MGSDDLRKRDVTPNPKPVSKRRGKPARRTDLESSAAWFNAVIHKRDAALWSSEDYPVVAGPGLPLLTEPDAVVQDDKPLHLLRPPPFQAHHIVPRQQCRKHNVPEWDTRNGVPVTKRRHERHHSRIEPITCEELPDEIYAFLSDYPVLWPYFNRMYPAANVGRSVPDFATKTEDAA